MITNQLLEPVSILPDEELVERMQSGDMGALEALMRRHNQRLYRIARGILRNDADAEEVVQDAYVRAYRELHQFEGRGPFCSWLSRIVVREALQRMRKRNSTVNGRGFPTGGGSEELDGQALDRAPGPAEAAAGEELRMVIQSAIDELPARLRSVVVLRCVEQMSTAQVAECLGIPPETVKTRLFRAKLRLRRRLNRLLQSGVAASYPFGQERCDRTVAIVIRRIAALQGVASEGPT